MNDKERVKLLYLLIRAAYPNRPARKAIEAARHIVKLFKGEIDVQASNPTIDYPKAWSVVSSDTERDSSSKARAGSYLPE